MLHGLRTAIYATTDLARAKAWYTDVLGFGPYFDEEYYVGFNVGGYELGLLPAETNAQPGAGGTTVYWGVDDAQSAFDRLIERGALAHDAVQDVGGGIRTATVRDPDGNVFGVIENPHFSLPDAS